MKRGRALLLICLEAVFCCGLVWAEPCSPRTYDSDSVVCVCNQTYCDSLDAIVPEEAGIVKVYESSQWGARFDTNTYNFTPTMKLSLLENVVEDVFEDMITYGARPFYIPTVTITLDASKQYQEIIGFGGAFTDAAGINVASLPADMQKTLIDDYYSTKGLEYNIGRIPIGSCDFSTRDYSYDDVENDFDLEHFQLANEDFKFKIPYIQAALNSSSVPILFFGSPWSSPYWMKTNNNMTGRGTLKGDVGGQYYDTWAKYFVKFIQNYEAQNISIWGLTAQNEPSDGFIPNFPFQSLAFAAETQRDFIAKNLGPILSKYGYGPDKVKLMILDDQRLFLPRWADVVLADTAANKYVSGVAYHWYANILASSKLLDVVHLKHPEKFLFSSEACTGAFPWDVKKVELGSWSRGEAYALDIIEDLNHWTSAWVDWNLALNPQGGPNWVSNFVDAPIIVNADAQEYYKQPMYYVLGHFSKFVTKNSVRIDAKSLESYFLGKYSSKPLLDYVAFKRPDGAYVLIALNRNNYPVKLNVNDLHMGTVSSKIAAKTIQTYIWWHKSA